MRILGLDLGTHQIKAVELETTFGRFEIRDYHERMIQSGETPAEAASALIASLPKPPEKIATAIPSRLSTARNLTFPTRDKRTIQNTLAFELEDELPFSIEELIFDHTMTSQQGQSTQIHVEATTQKALQEYIDSLHIQGIDPEVITSESWAFRILLNRALQNSEEAVILCNIGHERTVMYEHWRNNPVVAREIPWGGRDLTESISRLLNISVPQAEQFKHDQAHLLDGNTEPADLAKHLRKDLASLIQGLRQLDLSGKKTTRLRAARIYLTGSGSLIPGIAEVLSQQLHVPVEPLRALTALGVDHSPQTDSAFALALGLALSLVSSEKNTLINLRKGSFQKQGKQRSLNVQQYKKLIIGGGAVFTSILLSALVQSSYYRSQLDESNKSLEKAVKSFMLTSKGSAPSSGALRNYISQPSKLQKMVKDEISREKQISKLLGVSDHTPLEFMKDLSRAIPRTSIVDLVQFQVGASPTANYASDAEGTAALTFLFADEATALRVGELLSAKMTGFIKGKPESVTLADGSKRFKVTYSGKVW